MGQVCVLSIFNIKNVFSLYVECVCALVWASLHPPTNLGL
jgi:hypothetical protein